MSSYVFDINGLRVQAAYGDRFVRERVRPLLRRWQEKQREGERLIIFLAAPPAAGKSTLAALFEHEAKTIGIPFQALGMDGFHHRQSYIETHTVMRKGRHVPMKQVKGCPESFDFARLHAFVRRLRHEETMMWPWYDRQLHDVRDDWIKVTATLVMIEGNYLLLDEAPWRSLRPLCDASLFLEADMSQLQERLVERKIRGGMMPHEALAFASGSDMQNARRVLAHRLPADETIAQAEIEAR